MSKKSTKIIAVAGVVAGLGVAALPALTFAAQQSVSGGVNITTDVQEAIAMTITGNNDTEWNAGTELDPNPIEGDSVYNPSGTAMINSYDTADGEVFSGTVHNYSGSTTSILPNAKVDGDGTNGFKSLIKVYTNSANGYTISLQDADSSAALVLGNNVDTIPAGSSLSAGTAAWGYTLTSGSSYAAVPTNAETAATIKSDGAAFADCEETNVYYGVSTKAAQKSGTYTDTIVYTASTKNA